MKNLKFYINNMKDLNEYEKEHNRISYRRLVEHFGDIWLFNNAPELSDYMLDFEVGTDYDEENDQYIDIYQYYLFDINQYQIEKLNEINCNDLIIAWSDKLDNYILCVPHCGTSWDYVLTDIEPTENYEEADL